jgi:two-component system LytT family response regulator
MSRTAQNGLRVAVVDDEPLARRRVLALLADEPDVEVVAECDGGASAISAIERLNPDVVFLDVKMPEIDGFEVLQAIDPERLPVVIFATAYEEYAIRAIEHYAVGYLVKPIDEERFRRVLEHVRRTLAANDRSLNERLAGLLSALQASQRYLTRLPVRLSPDRVILVPVAQLDRVTADNNQVQLHIAGTTYQYRQRISVLERHLDPRQFLRVHRSTIVNVDRVREIRTGLDGDFLLLLHDGTRVVTSAAYRERVSALLKR